MVSSERFLLAWNLSGSLGGGVELGFIGREGELEEFLPNIHIIYYSLRELISTELLPKQTS